MKKRLFSFSTLLLYTLLGFAQFSGSGNGTEADPYQVTNAIQLSQLSNFLGQSGVVFQLQNDLDLTEWIAENNPNQGWSPIGVSSSPFKGVFIGGGHTISGLTINRTSDTYTGFFGCLSGASISDLKIEVKSVNGGTYVGALAGYASAGCKFTNCEVLSNLGTLTSLDNKNIGGLVGQSNGNNTFTSCQFYGELNGDSFIGGLVATIQTGSSTFVSCAVEGNITGTGNYIGGLIGSCTGIAIESMTDCYFYGNIQGASYVGGLVGAMTATDETAPTLHYYDVYSGPYSYNPRGVGSTFVCSVNDDIKNGEEEEKRINNCAVKGNIEGQNNVGGLLGSHNKGTYYTYTSDKRSWTHGMDYSTGNFIYYGYKKDGTWITDKLMDVSFTIRHYFRNTITLSLSNCSFTGNINGTENVGGLIGCKSGGLLLKSYALACVEGQSNVGGIIGKISKGDNNSKTTIQSNVAINDLVSATGINAGRIYGIADANYATIGKVGSNTSNRALTITKLMENGEEKLVNDDLQNGSSIGAAMLKMKDNYVAWGWDFDNDWSIQEGESYPYKKFQAAPPVIDSEVAYRATEISGRSADGGTVYLSYNGNEAIVVACEGTAWAKDTNPLKGGSFVTAYVVVDGKMPSYTVTVEVPKPEYVILDENSLYAPEASDGAENVQLNRTINAGEWSTIVLPFTATGTQVKAAFGNDVQLAEFTGWERVEDKEGTVGIKVDFKSIDANDGLAANTPLLIKVKEDVTTSIFEGVTITPENTPTVQVGWKASERGWFRGTYSVMQVPEENLFLDGNKFLYSTGDTTIKGYRGYFEFRDVLDAYYDGTEAKVDLYIDGTTGIKIVSGVQSTTNDVIYNLAGQRVGKAKNGIYIIGGRKQVVR